MNAPKSLPSTEFAREIALFLDVDGTLLEIADKPGAVEASAALLHILERLEIELGGALALVSGRTLEDLDSIFAPMRLPAAGMHGLERRDGSGAVHRAATAPTLDYIRDTLRDFASRHDGALFEDKGAAMALHYRLAPSIEDRARELVRTLTRDRDELHFLEGKMVFEIKSRHVDKGVAIDCFLAEAPFAGRLPVFLGDDVTDEDGFRFVNHHGGISIRVGNPGESAAPYRIQDVPSVVKWLEAVADNVTGG